jgi:hypothetical protein
LQVDGGAENWNRTMLFYLAWLVKGGVFEEVRMQRMPVGHSHSDIDGRWGNLSIRIHGTYGGLPGMDLYTVQEFVSEVMECFQSDLMHFEVQEYQWDFTPWATEVFTTKLFGGQGSGAAHAFGFGSTATCLQFKKDADGEVYMQYKTKFDAAEETHWLPGETVYPGNKTYPKGFAIPFPDEKRNTPANNMTHGPKVAPLQKKWLDTVDAVARDFLDAFAKGCGKVKSARLKLDYVKEWREWFAKVPRTLQDVFRDRPWPVFASPELGPRGKTAELVASFEDREVRLFRVRNHTCTYTLLRLRFGCCSASVVSPKIQWRPQGCHPCSAPGDPPSTKSPRCGRLPKRAIRISWSWHSPKWRLWSARWRP